MDSKKFIKHLRMFQHMKYILENNKVVSPQEITNLKRSIDHLAYEMYYDIKQFDIEEFGNVMNEIIETISDTVRLEEEVRYTTIIDELREILSRQEIMIADNIIKEENSDDTK